MALNRFGSQASRVYETIRNRILSRSLHPGDKIRVREMAASLGTSNGPVRDALLQLNNEKLVSRGHGVEWSVTLPTRQTIEEGMVVREALECQSARCCAQAATPEDVERLRKLAQQIDIGNEQGLGSDPLMTELDGRLHMAIAELSGSPQLCEEIERWKVVMDWSGVFLAVRSASSERPPGSSHVELIEAIATGDADFAERQMRRHIHHPWDDVTLLADDASGMKVADGADELGTTTNAEYPQQNEAANRRKKTPIH